MQSTHWLTLGQSTDAGHHYTQQNRLEELEQRLSSARSDSDVFNILQAFQEKEPADFQQSDIMRHRALIEEAFSKATVEEIFETLRKDGGEWSAKLIATMSKMSPLSLKVVHRQLQKGKTLPIDQCLKMEWRMSQAFMRGNEFSEGVRALLVDKDKNPRWQHSSIDKVSQDDVENHFLPIDKELTFPN